MITFALIGIVTLQLLVLQLNASIGRSLVREAQLQRANAALSIEGSELAGGERVETQAALLGMQLVPEGSLRFLTGDPRADVARAAAALKAPAHAVAASTGEAGATTPTAGTATAATASGTATETSPSGEAPATAATQPTSSTGESASSSTAAGAPASEAASPSASGTSSASAPTGATGATSAATSSEAPMGAAVGEAGGSGQPNGGGRRVAVLQRRVGGIFAAFFVLLVLAAGRTAYLGVVRGGTLRKAASNEQLTTEAVSAPRGTITDRNGVDLAISEPAQDISADPYLVTDPLGASRQLATLLGQTQSSVLGKLSEHRGFVYLARSLPARAAQEVLALKLAGVSGTPVMRRVYPRGQLAAQVLGMVGTEGAGLAGLEYSHNAQLAGRSGERRVVSDARGQPVSISESHQVLPGKSLTLTLDTNIQQRVEDVLAAVALRYEPKNATAIVMDPRTGAILALANWPRVNANDPSASPQEDMEDRGSASPMNRDRRSRS